jgi:hypothetical protein
MCQVGAYGMAVRGHAYHEILGHYYRGVRLGAIPASVATSSVAGLWVPAPEPAAADRAAVPVRGPADAGEPADAQAAPAAGATR